MYLSAMGTKNGANASFSVQSKIFPKLKYQILQMRYQNVQEGSSFTEERKNWEIFNLSSVKNGHFFNFLKHKLNLFFYTINLKNFNNFLVIIFFETLSFQNSINHNFPFSI